ncbi:unnamed protein product [Prorocentrum cordatum]|uniref:Uncharacterized protein n=1 Tax=Prorocentrum cordatum TaxID=2364126 RepID=A0ABN9TMH6_9DINO|nr:unnamed protein product [Polarella glacialis]
MMEFEQVGSPAREEEEEEEEEGRSPRLEGARREARPGEARPSASRPPPQARRVHGGGGSPASHALWALAGGPTGPGRGPRPPRAVGQGHGAGGGRSAKPARGDRPPGRAEARMLPPRSGRCLLRRPRDLALAPLRAPPGWHSAPPAHPEKIAEKKFALEIAP